MYAHYYLPQNLLHLNFRALKITTYCPSFAITSKKHSRAREEGI